MTSERSSRFGGFKSTIENVVWFVSIFQTLTLKSSLDRKCSPSGDKDKELI